MILYTQNENLFVDNASLIVVGQLSNVIEKLKKTHNFTKDYFMHLEVN